MYAVIKTGGKQYRVAKGDVLKVEKLQGEAGTRIDMTEILAVGSGESIKVGTPIVAGAKVVAEILVHGKNKKVISFKKKKRKGYTKKQGHRQNFTSIRIQEITA